MTRQPDSMFFSKLMNSANMGWWEADLESENYTCSEYISDLLGLGEDGIISFEDFNKRIVNEEQRPTTVHSFSARQIPEAVYLLQGARGNIWIRSKVCFQETDKNGKTKVYGIAEIQDGPDMASAYQALQYNERILYNIYKNLPVGIELYDKDGALVDLNDKELDMFGLFRKEDILGINIFENPVFPEEMKEKLLKNEDADFTFRYDFSKIGEYYPTRKREGTIDLMTKVTTLYDENHNPINYLLINADRTETTVAYNKIHEFENLFELVGDYSKVGYAYYNLLTKKGHAPKSWYRNIGEKNETPLKEIVGVYNHVHPEDRVFLVEFVRKAKEGMVHEFSREIRVLREDGSYLWTYVNLLLKNYAPQHGIIELISINYDITELKKTEEMLIKARDKAEESDRMKSAFLATISHEIRTPLNAIVGFSGLLFYTDDEMEKEQYNALIRHNNQLLLNIIDDILDFSRIEAGNIELYPNWFDLSNLIQECMTEYGENVQPEVKLLSRFPEHDYLVELDQMRIKQVLNNLVSNALKNTLRGHIEIAYELIDRGVRISVSDTGRGIPQDKIDKIFERFEKIDAFVPGVGLGLTICKSIVEKMGGRISVETQLGEGSTFKVELPCHVLIQQ